MTDSCFLCAGSNLAALTVGGGRRAIVVVSPRPFNSGEVMIAPRRHVTCLEDLDEEEAAELTEWIARVEAVMSRAYRPQGINLGCGLVSDASEHLAVRVTPRWTGDTNFMPVIAEVKVLPEALKKTVRTYRDAFAEK